MRIGSSGCDDDGVMGGSVGRLASGIGCGVRRGRAMTDDLRDWTGGREGAAAGGWPSAQDDGPAWADESAFSAGVCGVDSGSRLRLSALSKACDAEGVKNGEDADDGWGPSGRRGEKMDGTSAIDGRWMASGRGVAVGPGMASMAVVYVSRLDEDDASGSLDSGTDDAPRTTGGVQPRPSPWTSSTSAGGPDTSERGAGRQEDLSDRRTGSARREERYVRDAPEDERSTGRAGAGTSVDAGEAASEPTPLALDLSLAPSARTGLDCIEAAAESLLAVSSLLTDAWRLCCWKWSGAAVTGAAWKKLLSALAGEDEALASGARSIEADRRDLVGDDSELRLNIGRGSAGGVVDGGEACWEARRSGVRGCAGLLASVRVTAAVIDRETGRGVEGQEWRTRRVPLGETRASEVASLEGSSMRAKSRAGARDDGEQLTRGCGGGQGREGPEKGRSARSSSQVARRKTDPASRPRQHSQTASCKQGAGRASQRDALLVGR